jgi:hypothetical protein
MLHALLQKRHKKVHYDNTAQGKKDVSLYGEITVSKIGDEVGNATNYDARTK